MKTNDDKIEPLMVSVAKAAEMLDLDQRTIYALVRAGELERRYVGSRNYKIPVESLHAYIRSLATEAAS